MKCVELWAGDSTGLEAARRLGHTVVTVDNDPKFDPDILADIATVTADQIRAALLLTPGERILFIWASPDCSIFSVAGFHANHFINRTIPNTQAAIDMISRHKHTLDLIEELDPVYFVVENPVGLLRFQEWMQRFHRETVTYCSYGDNRMKPTDLWGGFPRTWVARPRCFRENPKCDHIRAPRGSGQATTARNKRERSHIPFELSADIFDAALESKGERWFSLREWL